MSSGGGVLLVSVGPARVVTRFGYGAAVVRGGALLGAASVPVPFASVGFVVFNIARVSPRQMAAPEKRLRRFLR